MGKLSRYQLTKSGLSLGMFAALVGGVGLLRTIALSILLDPENFGIAMTFSLVTTLMEMTSAMGLDRLLVQAKNGEEVRFQRTLQSIQLMRGLVGTTIIFSLSYPIALFFRTPDALWAYQTLAVVPFLKGLVNLDPYRQQRRGKIALVTMLELISVVVATIVAVGFAIIGFGFDAMLYSLVVQLLLFCLLMSFFSERSLNWAFDKDIAREALRFGWPLQMNAMLLYLTFYADRLIVGRFFTIELFGVFSLATSLTLTPTIILAKTLQTLALPVLSQMQGTALDQKRLVSSVVEICLATGILIQCMLAPLVVVGAGIVSPQNGVALGAMIILLSAGQTFRMAKVGPAIVHLAAGDSKRQLVVNMTRLLILPLNLLIAMTTNSVNLVILVSVIGELCGLIVALYWDSTLVRFAAN